MKQIKIKKLNKNAEIPKYAKTGDACLDMKAISKEENEFFIQYGTGLALEIPKGYVGLLFSRSSVSKHNLDLCNAVGVVDSGYRGEVCFRFRRLGEKVYEIGEKIGQIMIIPIPEIEFVESESLDETERGDGGFGSTGN